MKIGRQPGAMKGSKKANVDEQVSASGVHIMLSSYYFNSFIAERFGARACQLHPDSLRHKCSRGHSMLRFAFQK